MPELGPFGKQRYLSLFPPFADLDSTIVYRRVHCLGSKVISIRLIRSIQQAGVRHCCGMEGGAGSSVESSAGVPVDSGVVCKHRVPCVVKTSRTERNPGRRFLRCRKWKDTRVDCGFFQWVEKDTSEDEANTGTAVVLENADLKPNRYLEEDAELRRELRNLFSELRIVNGRLLVVQRMLYTTIIFLSVLAIVWFRCALFSS
ncbi:hypothetical protein LINPERHAP2_LOCUS301 [Linum perenne]